MGYLWRECGLCSCLNYRSVRILQKYKMESTDQYGHFDLRGIPPGDYKLFSWVEVEAGAWEDPEFLRQFEEKGQPITLQDGDHSSVKVTAIETEAPENSKP